MAYLNFIKFSLLFNVSMAASTSSVPVDKLLVPAWRPQRCPQWFNFPFLCKVSHKPDQHLVLHYTTYYFYGFRFRIFAKISNKMSYFKKAHQIVPKTGLL